jgi:hypothetical protein
MSILISGSSDGMTRRLSGPNNFPMFVFSFFKIKNYYKGFTKAGRYPMGENLKVICAKFSTLS